MLKGSLMNHRSIDNTLHTSHGLFMRPVLDLVMEPDDLIEGMSQTCQLFLSLNCSGFNRGSFDSLGSSQIL